VLRGGTSITDLVCFLDGYGVIVGLFAYGCEKLRYKGEMQPSELLDPVLPYQGRS
jgi:hypothetical protein